MQLPIEKIGDEGLDLVLEPDVREFPVLEDIRKEGGAVFESPIRFEVRAVRAESYIEIGGTFFGRARLTCSRCLAEFFLDLQDDFSLTYLPRPEMPEQMRPGEEAELSTDEIGLIPFDGDRIDLREGLQEQLVMALPVKPLCRPDCRGICPRCGADLNRSACRCTGSSVDPRLAVLRNLKLD
jgi:uncharacterized protein